MSFNLAVMLKESARAHGQHVAILSEEGNRTYADLDDASDRVAANLVAVGIRAGDTVGIQLPNVPAFAEVLYGVLKVGAIALPMNTMNKANEVAYYLRDAQAKALVTSGDCVEAGAEGAAMADVSLVFVHGVDTVAEGQRPYSTLTRPFAGTAPYMQLAPGDTAILLYTSGTTGDPKGVALTHFQLYMNAGAHVDGFEMTSETVQIAVMPLFHALGLSGILNATIRVGGSVVLMKKFQPRQVLAQVQEHRATLLHGVPTMYHALLNEPDAEAFDCSSLRLCGSAGAPIASELIDRFEKTFDVVILEAYGLTESGPVATFNRRNHRKPYSIGTPVWGVEVQVWDESFQQMQRGADHVGELVIRGHNTMGGYLNRPEATADAFAGGWLHTGDLGYQDEDGFFFIVDRKKELIIRGGYNVYPREVENVLYTHPDVDEVAVVGVPDERLGEEIKAYVTLRPGAVGDPEAIKQYAREHLAAYKYPRLIEVIEGMPKSPTGKILKKELAH